MLLRRQPSCFLHHHYGIHPKHQSNQFHLPAIPSSLEQMGGYRFVEQKSRADFAPDIESPLSKLTATDNIMLGYQDWKSSFAMLSNAEQC
jgi:hypothetical protein